MDDLKPTQHDIDSFRRFMAHMPGKNADLDLVVLKGHLLIEEQLRAIVKERIRSFDALDMNNINWSFYHVAHLAEALCQNEVDNILWKCITKLNKIRNEMAHNLEPKGLSDRIVDLNASWPSGFQDNEEDKKELLNLTLWSMYTALSGLVRSLQLK